jgi:hypothetical protein
VLWLLIWRLRRLSLPLLCGVSAACVLAIVCIAAARESFRLAHVEDLAQLYAAHARAAEIGGISAFAAFLVINLLLIALCIRLVRSRQSEPE